VSAVPENDQIDTLVDATARAAAVSGRLTQLDTSLGICIWELRTADRIGDIMDGIRGADNQPRHIKEGYQYVGGFPAHLWKLATADDRYRLLSHGIKTFSQRWRKLRQNITTPLHYVSIGPGTGEKDRAVLTYLQELAGDDKLIYVPIDISPELLKTGIIEATQEVDVEKLVVIPILADITSDFALTDLRTVLADIGKDEGMLISVLGNTLANFRDDKATLDRLASLLLGPRDKLLVEVATTTNVTEEAAKRVKTEYEGSPSFRRFVMATLSDFTNCTLDGGGGGVHYDSIARDGVIQLTANYTNPRATRVVFRDGEDFALKANEQIELLITRKYSDEALDRLLSDFDYVRTSLTQYSDEFGVVTKLVGMEGQELELDDPQPAPRNHPAGRTTPA
jgi:L-histidine Nalpha-methyltransferase